MGLLNALDPATIKAFERYLGKPEDGIWDDDLAGTVGAYQQLLGQTPGQTDDAGQWAALTGKLKERGDAFTQPLDGVPAQDPGYQAFMRSAGAQESEILDEIGYRTEQNSREINRRAVGFSAERAETQQNANVSKTQGTQKIQESYADRGFGGANSFREGDTQQLTGNVDRETQQRIGGIDEQQLQFNAGSRDALAEATRRLNGDANSLYRRRADEEFNARQRISDAQNTRAYGN